MTISWWDPETEPAPGDLLEHDDATEHDDDTGNADARGHQVAESPPRLHYGSVDEFVREYLRNVYQRKISGDGRNRIWAAEWWKYDEAVIRLEALWRAWEHLRQDPSTGMSVWWRDHADHHMPALMDTSGPFASSPDTTSKNEPLPYEAPPPGMFPDVR